MEDYKFLTPARQFKRKSEIDRERPQHPLAAAPQRKAAHSPTCLSLHSFGRPAGEWFSRNTVQGGEFGL